MNTSLTATKESTELFLPSLILDIWQCLNFWLIILKQKEVSKSEILLTRESMMFCLELIPGILIH